MTVAELVIALRELPQESEVWAQIGNHMDVVQSANVDAAGDVVVHGERAES